ncbi:hypothetical protein [Hoyosella altamirensis]|uniref:Uncharacterized protein n=1 Tax=Hoyosella altamirensis TaxID=616997 RepID=A0A839RHW8_9ACTN|nr:hypothetical protein [Hoyosella altamirensis]MBB3036010.1 hypothetical protein [Hoyosella altamirensis]
MNVSAAKIQGNTTRDLLSGYLLICNRAMAENKDKFWYQQAKKLNRQLWGGANFRTVIYETDPDVTVGEYTIHFDPVEKSLSILPPGDHDVAFTWKASTDYLRDVVHDRPDWYLAHPAMLDWVWMKERARDQLVHRVDGRSFIAGVTLGVAATAAIRRWAA